MDVTHDQIEAMTLADPVGVMNHGRIRQLGSPDEIYNDPAHLFVPGFIGSPAMHLLQGTVFGGVFSATGGKRIASIPSGSISRAVLGVRAQKMSGFAPSGNATWRRQFMPPIISGRACM